MSKSKYRYRESWGGGVTSRSLKALDKHITKVGDLVSIFGYLYHGRNNTNHIAVLITGSLGTMRLGGLSWGYAGEGVRGLTTVLEKLGVSEDEIKRITSIPWNGWSGNPRVIWESHFNRTVIEDGEENRNNLIQGVLDNR